VTKFFAEFVSNPGSPAMSDKVEIVSVPMMLSRTDIPEAIDVTPLESEPEEDPQVRIKAYDMFLNSAMDLEQIAVALAVPSKAVRSWARQGNWVSRKQDLLDVAIKASEQRMQEFVIKERLPTAERHLKVAQGIEETIDKTLEKVKHDDGSADPRVIKTLAEALSSSAGVSGKAVGITEAGLGVTQDQANKKMPVVIINLAPTLSQKSD
jgi:hypothetical protein